MATSAKKVASASGKRRERVAFEETPVRKAARRVLEDDDADASAGEASTYFSSLEEKDLKFWSGGAAIYDAMLGGGYAKTRVVNIVGDRSSGKTLLAIEACANYRMTFADDLIRYGESEHAFDLAYAEALGMPIDTVEFRPKLDPMRTVEDFFRDLSDFCKRCREKSVGGLYVLDSLDALSDDAEMKREIDETNTFGAQKAKKMTELFRKLVADMEMSDVSLIVVSQLKEKIGIVFGDKHTRTGGKALDYYASHIIWIAEIEKMKRTRDGVERIVGIMVKARVKKNKVGLPFRECKYPVLFGYGIDDITANVEWLLEVGRDKLLADEVGMSKAGYKVRVANLRDKGGEPIREVRKKLRHLVFREWESIERGFLPKARKY